MKDTPHSRHRDYAPLPPGSPAQSDGLRALSRRTFLRLAGMAAAGAALSACALPRSKPALQSRDKVQLVYQDWPAHLPMAQQMLEQLHATHPNIRVLYLS